MKQKFDLLRGQGGVFFAVNGMTALSFAFVLPIMSLFMVSGLNADPVYLGLYTTTYSIITIFVSQKLLGLIDKGVSSKWIFVLTLLGLLLSALSFSLATEFWHALLVGVFFMPFASSSIPVILSMIRRYADATGKDSTKLNSQMRSSVSLLWIVGPPLAFFSVDNLGFQSNFYVSACIAFAVILLVSLYLKPHQSSSPKKKADEAEPSTKMPVTIWWLGAVMVIANIANSSYLNTMPLYLTKELGFPDSYPGILLGLTAAVEIPVMLMVATWSARIGKLKVMGIGFAVAIVFYSGMFLFSSMPVLLALQLLNGLFFGIFVGLGVTIMQDQAPHSIGKASAIYTNSMLIGTMIGSSLMGLISQYFGFKAPLMLCAGSIIVAAILLIVSEKKIQSFTTREQALQAENG